MEPSEVNGAVMMTRGCPKPMISYEGIWMLQLKTRSLEKALSFLGKLMSARHRVSFFLYFVIFLSFSRTIVLHRSIDLTFFSFLSFKRFVKTCQNDRFFPSHFAQIRIPHPQNFRVHSVISVFITPAGIILLPTRSCPRGQIRACEPSFVVLCGSVLIRNSSNTLGIGTLESNCNDATGGPKPVAFSGCNCNCHCTPHTIAGNC